MKRLQYFLEGLLNKANKKDLIRTNWQEICNKINWRADGSVNSDFREILLSWCKANGQKSMESNPCMVNTAMGAKMKHKDFMIVFTRLKVMLVYGYGADNVMTRKCLMVPITSRDYYCGLAIDREVSQDNNLDDNIDDIYVIDKENWINIFKSINLAKDKSRTTPDKLSVDSDAQKIVRQLLK